jgi:hypothetical protein
MYGETPVAMYGETSVAVYGETPVAVYGETPVSPSRCRVSETGVSLYIGAKFFFKKWFRNLTTTALG